MTPVVDTMYDEDRFSHNWILKRTLNSLLLDRIGELSGLVVDLGCGRRIFEPELTRQGCSYLGLDWENSAHGLHADVIADLNDAIPLKDACADHILSLEVLEHLCEPMRMLLEAFRVLRSGGTLTMSVPFQWWVHEAPWDYYRYTEFGLTYLLSKSGFEAITIKPTSGFWTTWLVKLNYQSARLVRGPHMLRVALRTSLTPLWWITQHLAALMDRAWKEPRETVGYFVTARKP